MLQKIQKCLLLAFLAASPVLVCAYGAKAQEPAQQETTQQAVTATKSIQYYRLTPNQIVATLQQNKGKKVLYIYSASSPQTKHGFADMLALAQRLETSQEAHFVAVSVDTNMKELDRFLNIYSHIPYLPIVVVPTVRQNDLREELATLGIKFPNEIPFVAVLDANNIVQRQGTSLNSAEILAALNPEKPPAVVQRSIYTEEEMRAVGIKP